MLSPRDHGWPSVASAGWFGSVQGHDRYKALCHWGAHVCCGPLWDMSPHAPVSPWYRPSWDVTGVLWGWRGSRVLLPSGHCASLLGEGGNRAEGNLVPARSTASLAQGAAPQRGDMLWGDTLWGYTA